MKAGGTYLLRQSFSNLALRSPVPSFQVTGKPTNQAQLLSYRSSWKNSRNPCCQGSFQRIADLSVSSRRKLHRAQPLVQQLVHRDFLFCFFGCLLLLEPHINPVRTRERSEGSLSLLPCAVCQDRLQESPKLHPPGAETVISLAHSARRPGSERAQKLHRLGETAR